MKTRTKKCKNCAEQFTPLRFNQKYCFNVDCIRVWVDIEKAKKWAKDKREKKAELMTIQDYIKIAQQVFNQYINERDKGKPCISCRKPINGRVNASHYYNANNHWNLRFDERNVHSSCITCNQYLSGNLIEYRFGLVERLGEKLVEELDSEAKETRKFTIEELKEITATYKQKLKELKNN
jgi:hypothetical protein